MLKRLSSLALILVLGGSVIAGVPLHLSEHACGMAGMEMMDCCQVAQMQQDTPETAAARLCCVINCSQPGPTGAQFTWRTPSFGVTTLPPAVAQSPIALLRPPGRRSSTQFYSPNLQASYIRNLSLLI